MKPYLLALALLTAPAFAAGDRLPQASGADHRHCFTEVYKAVNGTVAVRACPQMMNFFKVQHMARQELAKMPCLKEGRVRSKINLRCYRPQLLPERQR